MRMHHFEHPLNEKVRIYLRVESLLQHIKQSSLFDDGCQHQLFFRSLFDLLEVFEQVQLKNELLKDVEKKRLLYQSWLNVDGVDESALIKLLQDIDITHSQLISSERFGYHIKKDRFLASVRQRFNLPGGAC